MRFYADTGTRALVLISLLAMFLLGRRWPRLVAGWLFGVIAGGLASGASAVAAGVGILGAACGLYLDHRHRTGKPTRRR